MGFATIHKLEVIFLLAICMVCGQENSLDHDRIPRYRDSYGSTYELARKLAFLNNPDYGYENRPSYRKCPECDLASDSFLKNSRSLQSRKRIDDFLRLQDLGHDEDLYHDAQYEKPLRESIDQRLDSPPRNPVHSTNSLRKKQYYPSFGLDSIGLRKRSSHFRNNGMMYTGDSLKENTGSHVERRSNGDDTHSHSFDKMKYISVTKRDGSLNNDFIERKEKSPVEDRKQAQKKTKPEDHHQRVEIDTTETPKNDHLTDKTNITKGIKTTNTSEKSNEKPKLKKVEKPKVTSAENLQDNKTKRIEKKSINWSDYFGLDRRKKSSNDVINDNDVNWFLEKYHEAVEDEAEKSSQYPLKFYKSFDKSENRKQSKRRSKDKITSYSAENTRIDDLNNKLQSMEDSIIDDAIKYTGGHEGVTDKQEIQKVKDELINRLAAAYNLENMRRALNEYKLSAAKEKQRILQEYKDGGDDFSMLAEKRLSLSKNNEDMDRERADYEELDGDANFIQDDEIDRQNYEGSSRYDTSDCPKIDRLCTEIIDSMGHYARLFRSACLKHQICLLCGNSSWFAPARQCNVRYLIETYEYCGGNLECQREAQRSVRHLLEANRSLRLGSLEDCNLTCPEKS